MSTDDLMYYYQSVVIPVTEYACPVWHTSLTKGQTKQLENVQRRALKIIFNNNIDDVANATNELPSLAERREKLTKEFFTKLLDPLSCLHHLLPLKRNCDDVNKLRHSKQYPPLTTRTEYYKKIVNCMLRTY